MYDPWDLLNAALWLVFLLWVVAMRLVLAVFDGPDADSDTS